MKRIIETDGKNGVIEIKGNPQETILYLQGKPIQYSWFCEIGSTWRYHIAQGLNNRAIEENIAIHKMLRRGIHNEGDFYAVTEYFNRFFIRGKYEYGYYELFEDINWVDIPEREEYESFDYYGGCFDLTPTQNSINKNLVQEYKDKILKGSRPVMVMLHVENSYMFFILDGHHKFLAYKEAKIKPHSIVITKLGNDYTSTEETIQLAKMMNCKNKEFINWMISEKNDLDRYKNQKLDLNKIFRRVEN